MSDFRSSIYYSYVNSEGNICINPLVYSFSKYTDLFPQQSMNLYSVVANNPQNIEAISNQLYGTQDYWWLLALLNGISDILSPLPINTTIYYPPEELITEYKSGLSEIISLSSNNNSIYLGGMPSTSIMPVNT